MNTEGDNLERLHTSPFLKQAISTGEHSQMQGLIKSQWSASIPKAAERAYPLKIFAKDVPGCVCEREKDWTKIPGEMSSAEGLSVSSSNPACKGVPH